MENNNELVVYGENGEILDCRFQRVDFSNPPTILSYCKDVKGEISNILDSTAQMGFEIDEITVDEKDIAEISGFGESLEESEKSKGKNSLIKGVKNLLAKVGIEAFKDVLEEDNYATRFKDYCELLDKITQAVEIQKQNTLDDIDLKNSIINEMLPLIKELEVMLAVGLKDKEEYDKQTSELEMTADPTDIDAQGEIQTRTQISAIFNNKLIELQKTLIAYKEQIHSYRILINTDMELVMANDSYLEDSAPLLKAQGSIMVQNKIQSKRIARQQALDAATNAAMLENAKQLQMNAQAAVDLSLKGRVNLATLEQLEAAIKNGAQIFKNGKKVKQELNTKERQAMIKLNDSLNQYSSEFLSLAEDNQIAMEAIQNPTQKRIGGK